MFFSFTIFDLHDAIVKIKWLGFKTFTKSQQISVAKYHPSKISCNKVDSLWSCFFFFLLLIPTLSPWKRQVDCSGILKILIYFYRIYLTVINHHKVCFFQNLKGFLWELWSFRTQVSLYTTLDDSVFIPRFQSFVFVLKKFSRLREKDLPKKDIFTVLYMVALL